MPTHFFFTTSSFLTIAHPWTCFSPLAIPVDDGVHKLSQDETDEHGMVTSMETVKGSSSEDSGCIPPGLGELCSSAVGSYVESDEAFWWVVGSSIRVPSTYVFYICVLWCSTAILVLVTCCSYIVEAHTRRAFSHRFVGGKSESIEFHPVPPRDS